MAEDPTAEELARKAALAKYPVFDARTSEAQKTSVSATGGESLDMLRFMWASNKLQEQHKMRTRTYPSNKTRCPHLAADVARISAQIPVRMMPKVQSPVLNLLSQRS